MHGVNSADVAAGLLISGRSSLSAMTRAPRPCGRSLTALTMLLSSRTTRAASRRDSCARSRRSRPGGGGCASWASRCRVLRCPPDRRPRGGRQTVVRASGGVGVLTFQDVRIAHPRRRAVAARRSIGRAARSGTIERGMTASVGDPLRARSIGSCRRCGVYWACDNIDTT